MLNSLLLEIFMGKFTLNLVSVLVFIFLVNSAFSQSLEKFALKANKGSQIDFDFIAFDNKGKEVFSSAGNVFILNDKYKMIIPEELLVIDDGAKRYIYKEQDDEIIIAPVNKDDSDIMENPFAVLRHKNNKSSNYQVEVVNGSTPDLPKQIILKSSNGAKYVIAIKKFKELTNLNDKLFEFDVKNYPNAIVTRLD